MPNQFIIAILLPCYNEEAAIAQTVAGFAAALPGATIYVYDNNSADRTVAVAEAAGAVVRRERVQGKGAVVRRMFADIDADVYVMADGDATSTPLPRRRWSRGCWTSSSTWSSVRACTPRARRIGAGTGSATGC